MLLFYRDENREVHSRFHTYGCWWKSQRAGGHDGGLQPLTVKMISQAAQKPGDDAFYVDGLEVNNVCLEGFGYYISIVLLSCDISRPSLCLGSDEIVISA